MVDGTNADAFRAPSVCPTQKGVLFGMLAHRVQRAIAHMRSRRAARPKAFARTPADVCFNVDCVISSPGCGSFALNCYNKPRDARAPNALHLARRGAQAQTEKERCRL